MIVNFIFDPDAAMPPMLMAIAVLIVNTAAHHHIEIRVAVSALVAGHAGINPESPGKVAIPVESIIPVT